MKGCYPATNYALVAVFEEIIILFFWHNKQGFFSFLCDYISIKNNNSSFHKFVVGCWYCERKMLDYKECGNHGFWLCGILLDSMYRDLAYLGILDVSSAKFMMFVLRLKYMAIYEKQNNTT